MKKISLLRGAGTRFATWFYAMHCLLRQKQALYATVHSTAYQTLVHNARVASAMQDIENSKFWRVLDCLLRAVLPALWGMRYCDANILTMDKIYYLMKRVDHALLSSQSIFMTKYWLDQWMGQYVMDWMTDWVLSLDSLVKKNFQVTTSQGKLVIIFSYFHIFCLAYYF